MTRASDRKGDPRTFSARASVLFNGDWAAEEACCIEDVVLQIQERRGPSTVPMMGRDWICNCHEVQGARYYMAQWSRRSGYVLTARTPEELARKMLRLGMEDDPGADGGSAGA